MLYNNIYKDLLLNGHSGGFNDVVWGWLKSLGYEGQLHDMLFKHLRLNGYTGNMNDMLWQLNNNPWLLILNYWDDTGIWIDESIWVD